MELENLALIENLGTKDISSICDHTFLLRSEYFKKEAKEGENPIRLREKAFYSFLDNLNSSILNPYAVCVRPEDVSRTKQYLYSKGMKNIKFASVVGFPDGSWYSTKFKIAETKLAIEDGADEIDIVINYDKLKKKDSIYVENEAEEIVRIAHRNNVLAKLIFENSELKEEDIILACDIASAVKADFIKTSTGFGAYGAREEDLMVMREHFQGGIKISGGVNVSNVKKLLYAASGRSDGYIDLNPMKIRIGESSLLF